MSENNPLWPLAQLNLYLSGYHSIECRCCQGYLKQSNGNGHKPALALETIQQAVSEALPLGLRAVRLCGEHAFLYPAWDALLAYLEKLELDVTIETNGSGLTKEQVARLAQLRLPHLRIIVGWGQINQAARTIETAPGAIRPDDIRPDSIRPDGIRSDIIRMAGIRALTEAGLQVQMVFPITRRTTGEIPVVINFAGQAGVKTIRFTSIPPKINIMPEHLGSNFGPGSSTGEALTVEEIIALGYKYERRLSNTAQVHLFFDHPPAFRGLHPQARVDGQGFCTLLNNLNILPGGVVALCSAVEAIPELAFGKIGAGSLEGIWLNNPVLQTLRDGMPDRLEGICSHCLMKSACMGYCIAENYLRSGTYFGPNWFCQTAEQVGLFPAGRMIENVW
jgi:radical SAM protein with 4Fe4S-binding SPASM domain